MHRNAAKVTLGGQRASWLGVNFWSRTGGPLMWRSYDSQVIREELRVLREHGLTMTRSFFYWPDFMPEPERIDEQMTARFADFLDRHAEAGLTTVPTFLVGHMSGENWDPAWRNGRDLYSDVWMVAREAWFAGEMVRRFASHPAVCGWLVSNEMPIYGGEDSPRETVSAWAQLIIGAIRAAGGTQPVSLGRRGVGHRGQRGGQRLLGGRLRTAVRLPRTAHLPGRQRPDPAALRRRLGLRAGLHLRRPGGAGGVRRQLRLHRRPQRRALLPAGAAQLAAGRRDRLGGLEQHRLRQPRRAGPLPASRVRDALRADRLGRAPKPQLAEMAAFAAILGQVGSTGCTRADSDTALVVPSYLDTVYPFTQAADRSYLAEVLRQAYVCARLADVPPALTRESDGLSHDARLYLLPSTKQLLSPTWHELEALAEAGATVYVSYSPGAHPVHAGPWYARLNGMFGVQHELGYGAPARIEEPEITLTLAQDFGGLAAGAQLTFPAAGTGRSQTYLPVRPDGAEVLAVDSDDRPALLRRRAGRGALILCTYPLEYMAALTPQANPSAVSTLYDALASDAGVRRPVTVDDPRVAADVLVHEDGRHFAWLVSHAAEPVTVKPQLSSGTRLCELDGTPANEAITLPPFGVGVFCLENGAAGLPA